MDESLLPPREAAPRALPFASIAMAVLPVAALAAGFGLQTLVEGSSSAGDPLLRWLLWSGGAGLVLGAGAALVAPRARVAWVAYGAVAPVGLAAVVAGAQRAALPVREWVAAQGEARCRATGRGVCTVAEFTAACRAAGSGDAHGRERLGAPRFENCGADGCTARWVYTGPWRPDTYVAPGALQCSVVTDAKGHGVRLALMPGAPVD